MRKKKSNAKLYIGLFVAFIMVSSVFGVLLSSNSGNSSFKYGEFKFSRTYDGTVYTKINGKKVLFYYEPQDLEYIQLPSEVKNFILVSKVVSLTYNPNSKEKELLGTLQYEFENLFRDFLDIIVQRGVTDNKDYKMSKITCSDATSYVPVILYEQGDEEKYLLEDNCITIIAKDNDGFMRLSTRLLYGLFGVIDE